MKRGRQSMTDENVMGGDDGNTQRMEEIQCPSGSSTNDWNHDERVVLVDEREKNDDDDDDDDKQSIVTRNAMHCNNLGVILLENNQIYQARYMFCLAVDEMKKCLDQDQLPETIPNNSSSNINNSNNRSSVVRTLPQRKRRRKSSFSTPSASVTGTNIPQNPTLSHDSRQTTTTPPSNDSSHHHHPSTVEDLDSLNGVHHRDDRHVQKTATEQSSSSSSCFSRGFSNGKEGKEKSTTSLESSNQKMHDFLRPVFFSDDMLEEESIHELPLVKISISLLFNLALSNHTIALKAPMEATTTSTTPSSSSTSPTCPMDSYAATFRQYSSMPYDDTPTTAVEDAIFYYQLAYGLQRKHNSQQNETIGTRTTSTGVRKNENVELSWLHTMGMINNVGKLLAHVGVVDEAQKCFRHLLKQILVQQASTVHTTTTTTTTDTTTTTMDHNTANVQDDDHHSIRSSPAIGGMPIANPPVDEMHNQIEGFLDNILFMVLRTSATSPAA